MNRLITLILLLLIVENLHGNDVSKELHILIDFHTEYDHDVYHNSLEPEIVNSCGYNPGFKVIKEMVYQRKNKKTKEFVLVTKTSCGKDLIQEGHEVDINLNGNTRTYVIVKTKEGYYTYIPSVVPTWYAVDQTSCTITDANQVELQITIYGVQLGKKGCSQTLRLYTHENDKKSSSYEKGILKTKFILERGCSPGDDCPGTVTIDKQEMGGGGWYRKNIRNDRSAYIIELDLGGKLIESLNSGRGGASGSPYTFEIKFEGLQEDVKLSQIKYGVFEFKGNHNRIYPTSTEFIVR